MKWFPHQHFRVHVVMGYLFLQMSPCDVMIQTLHVSGHHVELRLTLQSFWKWGLWTTGMHWHTIIKDVIKQWCIPFENSAYFGDGDGVDLNLGIALNLLAVWPLNCSRERSIFKYPNPNLKFRYCDLDGMSYWSWWKQGWTYWKKKMKCSD